MSALWLVMLGMGLVTYALRLAPIALLGRFDLPAGVWQALRFVPPAVLAAIIVPDLLLAGGVPDVTIGNARLLAGLVAALVAWRTRSILATLVAGLAVFWTLRLFFP